MIEELKSILLLLHTLTYLRTGTFTVLEEDATCPRCSAPSQLLLLSLHFLQEVCSGGVCGQGQEVQHVSTTVGQNAEVLFITLHSHTHTINTTI